jgi:UDP-N-acetylmuramoylalanine--D-glutamate ligase
MDLKNKKIGIWGFGVVGQSVFNYVKKITDYVQILDQKAHANMPIIIQTPETIQKFLQENDYIIPSPGIIVHDYEMYRHKFLYELDLFMPNYHGTTIAITGTAGKTTVTDFIAQSIPNSIAAGNIGFAMLDVLALDPQPTTAVLELSSYQLQHAQFFTPDIAIWTNFFPNHLDHHKDINEYFVAKCNILKFQNKNQKTIIPLELFEQILSTVNYQGELFTYSVEKPDTLKNISSSILNKKIPSDVFVELDSTIHIINKDLLDPRIKFEEDPSMEQHFQKNTISQNYNIAAFYLENNHLILWQHGQTKTIFSNFNTLPKTTFPQNWIVIIAGLYLAHQNIFSLDFNYHKPQPHRVEHIGNYKNIAIYNDSKSTIQESTKQALTLFAHKKIALILGGMSKGANREPLIKYIAQQKNITPFIFGKEKEILSSFCNNHQLAYFASETLDEIVKEFISQHTNFDVLLFSPAGSSFDQFKNYQDRGQKFKDLMHKLS